MKTRGWVILVVVAAFSAGAGAYWGRHLPASAVKKQPLYYQHPMRPDVRSPVAAKDEMGMDYIPVYEESSPTIRLTSEQAQVLRTRTAEAAVRTLTRSVRTYGTVAFDPALYNALAEYREAVHARESVRASPWKEARERAESLVEASKLKLKLLGVSPDQITNERGLLLREQGKQVWVYADVYEADIPFVKAGLKAAVSSPSAPGAVYEGYVRAIDPSVNPTTRTARARIELSTADEKLKPEMFVDVSVEIPYGDRLAVPVGALFDTGERAYVFVETAADTFVPRAVVPGVRTDDWVEIVSGVQKGDRVAAEGNFLLDSESRFRAGREEAEHRHD